MRKAGAGRWAEGGRGARGGGGLAPCIVGAAVVGRVRVRTPVCACVRVCVCVRVCARYDGGKLGAASDEAASKWLKKGAKTFLGGEAGAAEPPPTHASQPRKRTTAPHVEGPVIKASRSTCPCRVE